MDNKDSSTIMRMNMESLLKWIDVKFNNKYKNCLESLKERFTKVYSLLKIMLEGVIELNSHLKISCDIGTYNNYKPLIDNIVRLLDMTINEIPEYIDLEFVEAFFSSIQERIQIFWAHFHQILHIQITRIENYGSYNKLIKSIENAGKLLPDAIIETRNRTKLSYPLLKHIKDSKNILRVPIKKFKQEIIELSQNKSYEEYENIYEEVKNRSKGNMKIKIDFIEKSINLVKEGLKYQNEINKMLKPYFTMANIYKNNTKNSSNENNFLNDAKLLKYINYLSRSDFTSSILLSLDLNELIYTIKMIESESSLVSEYKKSLNKGIEEYVPTNITELELTMEKYKLVMNNIILFQEETKRNFSKFNKETTNQIFKDITKVVDKYKEYQNGIIYYQELLELFQKIRDLTVKFCFQEFNAKIELICEYNF